MNNAKNGLSALLYFVIGIIVLFIIAKVIWWMFGLALRLVAIGVSVAIVILVGYLVVALAKTAMKNMK